jgi:translation initiation factor IF-3
MAESLKDVASVEGKPSLDGRRMNVVLAPVATPKTKEEKVKEKVK